MIIANTLFQQPKRRLYIWTSPDGQTKIRLIIFFSAKDGEALCSQTLELGKATRPFRYDLNQICFVYTVEVTNRFKELDPIDRQPEELWTEVRDIV